MFEKLTRGKIEAFLAKHATDAHTLDIGAGGKDHLAHFPNRVTLDIDPSRKPDVVGDAEHLPFPDESFEAVVCSEVFEHIKNPRHAAEEMWRVLRPGGALVLTTRFGFPVHDAPGDYWRFTPYALKMIFSHWEIIEVVAETGSFGTIAVLLQRIMFQSDLRGGKITKGTLYVLARIFDKLDWLVLKQYGDIARKKSVDMVLSSGIYLAARKPAELIHSI